jgi:DNA-binding NtrC family response regulator
VRVVVATHHDLATLVREGKFREDLYHRVVVFPITLPPLRARSEDIPALVEHFAQQTCAVNGWKPVPIRTDAIDALKKYDWPGNIRELRNIVERLLLLTTSEEVDFATVALALPTDGRSTQMNAREEETDSLSSRMARFERATILGELERQGHHVTNTAKALGLERSHLYKKCEYLGIDLRASHR